MYLILSYFLRCHITSKKIVTEVILVLPVSGKASCSGLPEIKKECLQTFMLVIRVRLNWKWSERLGTKLMLPEELLSWTWVHPLTLNLGGSCHKVFDLPKGRGMNNNVTP